MTHPHILTHSHSLNHSPHLTSAQYPPHTRTHPHSLPHSPYLNPHTVSNPVASIIPPPPAFPLTNPVTEIMNDDIGIFDTSFVSPHSLLVHNLHTDVVGYKIPCSNSDYSNQFQDLLVPPLVYIPSSSPSTVPPTTADASIPQIKENPMDGVMNEENPYDCPTDGLHQHQQQQQMENRVFNDSRRHYSNNGLNEREIHEECHVNYPYYPCNQCDECDACNQCDECPECNQCDERAACHQLHDTIIAAGREFSHCGCGHHHISEYMSMRNKCCVMDKDVGEPLAYDRLVYYKEGSESMEAKEADPCVNRHKVRSISFSREHTNSELPPSSSSSSTTTLLAPSHGNSCRHPQTESNSLSSHGHLHIHPSPPPLSLSLSLSLSAQFMNNGEPVQISVTDSKNCVCAYDQSKATPSSSSTTTTTTTTTQPTLSDPHSSTLAHSLIHSPESTNSQHMDIANNESPPQTLTTSFPHSRTHSLSATTTNDNTLAPSYLPAYCGLGVGAVMFSLTPALTHSLSKQLTDTSLPSAKRRRRFSLSESMCSQSMRSPVHDSVLLVNRSELNDVNNNHCQQPINNALQPKPLLRSFVHPCTQPLSTQTNSVDQIPFLSTQPQGSVALSMQNGSHEKKRQRVDVESSHSPSLVNVSTTSVTTTHACSSLLCNTPNHSLSSDSPNQRQASAAVGHSPVEGSGSSACSGGNGCGSTELRDFEWEPQQPPNWDRWIKPNLLGEGISQLVKEEVYRVVHSRLSSLWSDGAYGNNLRAYVVDECSLMDHFCSHPGIEQWINQKSFVRDIIKYIQYYTQRRVPIK